MKWWYRTRHLPLVDTEEVEDSEVAAYQCWPTITLVVLITKKRNKKNCAICFLLKFLLASFAGFGVLTAVLLSIQRGQ